MWTQTAYHANTLINMKLTASEDCLCTAAVTSQHRHHRCASIHPQFCERSPLTFQERSQPSSGEAPGRRHLSVTFTIFNCLVVSGEINQSDWSRSNRLDEMLRRGLFISRTVWRLLRASPTHRTETLQGSQAFILKSILTWKLIRWSERNTSEWSITYFKVHSDNKARMLFLNDQMDSYNFILSFFSQEVF